MSALRRLPRVIGLGVIASALVAAMVPPGAAPAAEGAPAAQAVAAQEPDSRSEPAVSARLRELARPDLRSLSWQERAQAVSVPVRGPGSIARGPHGSVRVSIKVNEVSDELVGAIRERSVNVLHVSSNYSTITASVALKDLATVGGLSGVIAVTEVVTPLHSNSATPFTSPSRVGTAALGCNWLVSRADTQEKAASARTTYGVDGTGLKIGVLSTSFAATTTPTTPSFDVSIGALPGPGNPCGYTKPVKVVQDYAPSSDEGRAMLQLVHSVAPGAELMFATTAISETSFADNIRKLADAGADILVDDAVYLEEPMFQEGDVANAVTYARDVKGVTYFSAAGNLNYQIAGQDVGSWEAPAYRPTSCPPSVVATSPTPLDCMNFAPSGPADNTAGYTITDGRGVTPFVQWAEPLYGVTTELSLFLLDATSGAVLASGPIESPTVPFAYVTYQNETGADQPVDLVVARAAGSGTPRLKMILAPQPGAVLAAEYAVSAGGDVVGPTSFAHNGGKNTISVGAINATNSTTPESFSSRGPNTHYFAPVNGTVPAAALPGPSVLMKPDLTGTDGDCTTFFSATSGIGPTCPYEFSGTSAAAPNAAAVAALVLQMAPRIPPA